jgi:hypothetical protein
LKSAKSFSLPDIGFGVVGSMSNDLFIDAQGLSIISELIEHVSQPESGWKIIGVQAKGL